MISFTLPLKAPSTANLREHWATRHRRTQRQRAAIRLACPRWGRPVLIVVLTRIAPRRLDDDNMAGAMKGIRDAVASWLRIDDASPLVQWMYWQEKGEPGVRVECMTPLELGTLQLGGRAMMLEAIASAELAKK